MGIYSLEIIPIIEKEFNYVFNENDFYEIKASFRSGLVHWDILFDNIYFGENNNINIQKKQTELHANMRLSIGTDEYKDYRNKNFFEKYINERKYLSIKNSFK